MRVFTTHIRDLSDIIGGGLDHFQFSYLFDYNFLINALKERGIEVDSLKYDDYGNLFKKDKFAKTIDKHLSKADIIFHNRFVFKRSLIFLNEFFQRDESEINRLEHELNFFIYKDYRYKTHGTIPPYINQNEDPRFKNNLPYILALLNVPTPKLVDGTTFPFYLKHKASSRGFGVHFIKNKSELNTALLEILNKNPPTDDSEKVLSDYICQEAIEIPTKEQTHFRTVCWDKHLIGGAIYIYKDGLKDIIPLKESRERELTRKEKISLEAYGLDGTKLPDSITDYSKSIGGYCSRRGFKMVGLDFVVNKESKAFCIDVNRDPGLEFYLAYYFGDCKSLDLNTLKAKAGEVNAEIIVTNYSKKLERDPILAY